MLGCAKLVDKLGRLGPQVGYLYPLYTNHVNNGFLFVTRPCTDGQALGTGYASRLWRDLSVKYSYTRYTQGLLMQIN